MSSDHSQRRFSSPVPAVTLTTRSTSGNSNRWGVSASRSFGPISGSVLISSKVLSRTSRNSAGERKLPIARPYREPPAPREPPDALPALPAPPPALPDAPPDLPVPPPPRAVFLRDDADPDRRAGSRSSIASRRRPIARTSAFS